MKEIRQEVLEALTTAEYPKSPTATARNLAVMAEEVLGELFIGAMPTSGYYGRYTHGSRHPDHEFHDPQDLKGMIDYYNKTFKKHFIQKNILYIENDLAFFHTFSDPAYSYTLDDSKEDRIRFKSINTGRFGKLTMEIVQKNVVFPAENGSISVPQTLFSLRLWNRDTGISELVEAQFTKMPFEEQAYTVDVSFTATMNKDPSMIRVSWNGIAMGA